MNKYEMIEANYIALVLFDATNVCMSVAECAEFLGVHEKTVKNRIYTKDKTKKIEAKRYGKGYSIPKAQFIKEIVEKFKKDEGEWYNTKLLGKPERLF
ncbi:hypothetical protein [Marinifilum sp. D737]|uniref:hypothetical protein n=1 Tax=Marinifilum sp. D737 TaxID=2969628 RepID=UPI0022749A70|nr:hypothetical protein [Marinifilum sp. D737]MCY1634399.1 hypothetical protein [Marinifilum sp. D737]